MLWRGADADGGRGVPGHGIVATRSKEESITRCKQARLAALAEAYVQAHDRPGDYQVDIIAIEMDRGRRLLRLNHYEKAVIG